MDCDLSVPDYGILSRLTGQLRAASELPFIYVVPAPVVGFDAWEKGEYDECNAKLGEAASAVVWRELKRMLAIAAWREEPRFRIGVAGGQTTYAIVESLSPIHTSIDVKIAPLVLGAVPRHRYSAGTIADILSHKLEITDKTNADKARLESIEVWLEKQGQYQVTLSERIVRDRGSVAQQSLEGAVRTNMGFFDFSYLLVGIGAYKDEVQDTNIAAHMNALYGAIRPPDLCGDICSRLFDSEGKEIDGGKQDQFVSVSLKCLKLLVKRGTPVIAVAGGPEKIPAIQAVLRGHRSEPLVSGLITDELTATELYRHLRLVPRSKGRTTAVRKP